MKHKLLLNTLAACCLLGFAGMSAAAQSNTTVNPYSPAYGHAYRHGVMPNSYTFDHAGPLAWTVEDCAILLECIAGHDPADPTSARRSVPRYTQALGRDIRGLKVGVVRHYWEEEGPVDEELAQAMEVAIEVLQRLGAKIGTARMRTCT